MQAPELRTKRLLLRAWSGSDRGPFAALNADPEVMQHFRRPLSTQESDAFVDLIGDRFERSGWGLWAVEIDGGDPFIGYVGLWPADFVAPGTVEVGWRLARCSWGQGYAPEAAAEALRFGFENAGLDEIVSFTVPANTNSLRVMDKIGLCHRPDRDFDHPAVDAAAHPHLVRHVLYSLSRSEWATAVADRPAGPL